MRLKLFILVLAGISLAGLVSCDKEQLGIDINHTFRIQNFELDTVPFVGEVTLGPFPVQNDLDSILSASGADKNKIQKVTLKSASIEILSPDTGNFDPFVDIETFISGDGLPEKSMAGIIGHTDDGARVLQLTPTTEDMKEYILKNPLQLRVRVKTDEPLKTKLTIKLNPQFTIRVGLLD